MRSSRVLALLIVPALLGSAFAGCLTGGDANAPSTGKPLVLTTVYPVHYLTTRLAGDELTVESVSGRGVQPHGWEPAARDIGRLGKADLLVAQGLGFEPWVPRVLETLGQDAPPVVEASTGLPLLAASADHVHDDEDDHDAHANESHVDDAGNETHDDHDAHANDTTGDHDAHDEDDHADTHEGEVEAHDDHGHDDESEAPEPEPRNAYDGTGTPDPHTWTDPVRYAEQARNVERALADAFPEHADAFRARADALVAELEALDAQFEDGLSTCNVDVIIVSHNAFAYLADRYGFDVLAVHGLSPEVEPDAKTVRRLVDAAHTYHVPAVFVEELADPRVVQVIADEVDADVLVLSPIEGLTKDATDAGADYVTLQEQNLQNLRKGMECL